MSKELDVNSTLSHYRIVSKIGAGGMGEVYLAQDTKLDRKVALKILPTEVAQDKDRLQRFIQEARTVSNLNHPNIITVYEFGQTESHTFMATEFVDGVTLREYVSPRRLNFSEILDITIQIVAALNAAHVAGVTHRDLKPENVMVRNDRIVKVLDFGLAKLSARRETSGSDEDATRILLQTQPGVVMGTVAYMSPEQARGQEVDQRTDIWSLGCVLYELLTAQQPFGGETMADALANIIHREPWPLTTLRPDVNVEFERIVNRTLAKDRDQRYANAGLLLEDLKQLQTRLAVAAELERTSSQSGEQQTQIIRRQTTSADAGRNSIAVMPFSNMSADPDNEYFCEGLAEELINALAKIDDLKVAARTSAFSFKGKNANVSEIGQRLGVRTVLEGSVRRAGNRLRISVQLVNAADGFHLWSERYDRQMQGIFELQDEITLSVIDALKVRLLGNERDEVLKRYTDNAQAYEMFLKGRYHHFKYTAESWKRAIEFFEKAIEIEPSYAPAYAAMASSWGYLGFFGLVPSETAMMPIKESAARALRLDQDLAEAHLSSALVSFFYDWDWRKAEEEFKCALELSANNAEAFSFYSMFLALEDRFDEAIMQSKQSLALDPLSPLINMNAGWTYFTGGLMDEALEQVGKMIEIEPGFYGAYWLHGAIHLAGGNYQRAVDELRTAVSFGGHEIVLGDLGSAYALAGRRAEAESVLNQLLETRQHEYVSAICIARVYCRLGEAARTIEWLEKAFAERNGEMLFLKGEIEGAAQDDPLINLSSDRRVTAIFQKMNLAKERR